jgi:6-phosphogluconolactonase
VETSEVTAYVAHSTRGISVLALSQDGRLVPVQDVPLSGDPSAENVRPGQATTLSVSPDRRFLYAVNRTAQPSVTSYAIDQVDGSLRQIGETVLPGSPPYISTDPAGRFLLASYNPHDAGTFSGFVTASVIDEGVVRPHHQLVETPPKAHSIISDRSGRFVFTPCTDGDVVKRFALDAATGILDPDAFPDLVARPGAGPRHIISDRSNRFLYTLTEYDGSVYVHALDVRDGRAEEVQVQSVIRPGSGEGENARGGDLRITPDGRFLYTALRATSSIAYMPIHPGNGRLGPVSHQCVDKEPRGFTIDPLGRFLIACGFETNRIVSYRIDPSVGALEQAYSFESLPEPNWIETVQLG